MERQHRMSTLVMIRKARPEDIPEVARVLRRSFREALPFIPELHTPEEDLEFIANTVFPKSEMFVAVIDDVIQGFIAFDNEWVHHLYLLPEATGRGIGKLLLNLAKTRSHRLQLWVFQKNSTARGFYESQGFKLVKETDGSCNEEHEPDALYEWVQVKTAF
jgi:putative acetyltransferase